MTNDDYLKKPIDIESELLSLLSAKKKLTFLDIGSCDGLDSIKYSRLFPNAKIYAFEPIEKNFNLIIKNIKELGSKNIIPIQTALSNKSGETEFYTSYGKPEQIESDDWDYGNKSSSLLEPFKTKEIFPWLKFTAPILVKTSTLKRVFEEYKFKTIDFIHMDVQGAELLVMEGAENRLKDIKIIWMEVESIELYKNQPVKKDVEQFLEKNNFLKVKDTVNNICGDQLWIQKKYFTTFRVKNKLNRLKKILFK
jgi:FkbM family methyltransferase